MEAEPARAGPPALAFLRAWVGVGVQSFGGGSTTLLLMRRAMVEQHGWISAEEFTRYWGIVQIAPGINLIGQAILIGWRVLGAPGVAMALTGLLLPSVAITALLTAAYATVREQPLVESALRGVVPATVGMGLILTLQMARAPLAESRAEGRLSLAWSIAVLAGCGLVAGISRAPVLVVLWGAGAVCAAAAWLAARWRRP
jgi:chromate transporter